MIDLHVHTSRCGHATGSVSEYVEAARRAGISLLTFTDHLPMPRGYPQHYTMALAELPHYAADVRAAAAESAASGGPEIRIGIEADWLPSQTEWVRDRISELAPDVVLGSVHFIDDWAFDDPTLVDRYGEWEIDALWDRYFAEVGKAARSGLFDVIAHPDLVKKFGFLSAASPEGWYEEAALAMAEGGCAVEVNTAGLRKPIGDIYPSLELLRACRRRGVPATLGSDAHAPEEVAAGFAEARELLRAAGYDSLAAFRGRSIEAVPL